MPKRPIPAKSHLSAFTRLSPSTYLYDPFAQKPNEGILHANPRDPDTIILCTWPGAKQNQISRYTSGYAALFPTARILVITPDPSASSSSSPTYKNTPNRTARAPPHHLQEAAAALLPTSYVSLTSSPTHSHTPHHARRDSIIRPSARRGVLLHLFSTPGALQACALARAYRSLSSSSSSSAARGGVPLEAHAVVFDAIPVLAPRDLGRDTTMVFARDGVLAGLRAVASGVWSWVWGSVEQGVVGSVIEEGGLGFSTLGEVDAEALARDLNDRTLLRQGARHCYVYPERNVIESWKASREGRVETMEWFVMRDRVDVTGADGVMSVDETRYWAAVEELWID